MTDALDLRPLDAALRDLGDAVSGHSAAEILMEAGQIVQSGWRDNIAGEGLVDTGRYLESIAVEVVFADNDGARVAIGSDAVNEAGFPYPVVLEYGTSDTPARPVGMRAFDNSRRRVVKGVGEALERRVRSRARK